MYGDVIKSVVKEARKKVLKYQISTPHLIKEGSTLNMVMQYLKENPDLLESIQKIIEGREGLKRFEQGE